MADDVFPYFPAALCIEAACAVFGVTVEDTRGVVASTTLRRARQAAVLLLEEFTPMSGGERARALGRTHTSTAREITIAARAELQRDPRFAQTVEQARKRLLQGLHV